MGKAKKAKAKQKCVGASLGAVKGKDRSSAYSREVEKTHIVVKDKTVGKTGRAKMAKGKKVKRRTLVERAVRNSEYDALEAREAAAAASKERQRMRAIEAKYAPAVISFQAPTFTLPGPAPPLAPAPRAPSKVDQMLAEVADARFAGGEKASAGGESAAAPVTQPRRRRPGNIYASLANDDDSDDSEPASLAFAPASFQLPATYSSASLPGSKAAAVLPHAAFHAAFGVGLAAAPASSPRAAAARPAPASGGGLRAASRPANYDSDDDL